MTFCVLIFFQFSWICRFIIMKLANLSLLIVTSFSKICKMLFTLKMFKSLFIKKIINKTSIVSLFFIPLIYLIIDNNLERYGFSVAILTGHKLQQNTREIMHNCQQYLTLLWNNLLMKVSLALLKSCIIILIEKYFAYAAF